MWWWLVSAGLVGTGIARAGTTARSVAAGDLAPCVRDPGCAAAIGEAVADELRAATLGAEASGLGLSPAVVRGTGGLIELSAQSLAIPGFVAPDGVGVAPAVPRLGIGGVTGSTTRFGGGVELGAAIPTQASELGFGGGVHLGLVVGDPDQRRWVGFELDAGLGVLQGQLVDRPDRIAQEPPLAGLPIQVAPCGVSCLDQAILGYAGLDTVVAYDVDQTTVLAVRFGGVWQGAELELAAPNARWTWSGASPRAGALVAYRPHPRAVVGIAARVAILPPPVTTERTRLPWTGAMSFGWRFGAEAALAAPEVPRPVTPAPAPVPAPAPRVVPRVPIVEHPELQCEGERLPTGFPPPHGTRGWCVRVVDGAVLHDGPYIEWYDADHIRVRGWFENGREHGQWTEFDPSGALIRQGMYVDGLKEGVWTSYSGGRASEEGRYVRGNKDGQWLTWFPDGGTRVETWVNGRRDGVWLDYDAQGNVIGERHYRDDMLVYDNTAQAP